jgi:molybdopterin-guanine dinucleotide biosynthesis protein A
MGTDKAQMNFDGGPLVERAVATVRAVCGQAHILSGNYALAAYGPLVEDLHPGCGPIGGMEAALTHSPCAWNLFLSVDMPLLPVVWLKRWLGEWSDDRGPARIRLFTAGGRPQPGFCMLHQDVLPFLTDAIGRGDYKLMRVFECAAEELGIRHGERADAVLWKRATELGDACGEMNMAQVAARPQWFANVNTPEEFAAAERCFTESVNRN